jgi:hypothetical protein
MPNYSVFVSQKFDAKLANQEKAFCFWVEKIFDKLKENPFVGEPLGVKWFREKKFKSLRIYFLIFEDKKAVYLVNLSGKKDQQKIINSIWLLFGAYKKELENLLDK